MRIKSHLEKEVKRSLTLEEFNTLCKNHGLSPQQSSRILQSLSDTGITMRTTNAENSYCLSLSFFFFLLGVVLYFSNSQNENLKRIVFLQPQEFNSTIHQ